jgi:aminopeptidase N
VNKTISLLVATIILALGCGTSKKSQQGKEEVYEEVMLDSVVVDGNDPKTWDMTPVENKYPYRPSAKRTFDLIHTNLNLKFDWSKQHVLGQAKLDLTPLFYNQDSIYLDAKQFDIKSITLGGKNLSFKNTGSQLAIALDRTYTKNEKLQLIIDYVAKPNEGPSKGSAAITSDKGLFFINPLNNEPNKPQQIWSQGETENNSRWFPTFDKPNERCTQELTLTVEDKFTTLSNGKLISSTKNTDGTRTDYWKQDKPHAPYLFMIAVGEYATIEDKWESLPLYYLVEKPFAAHAKQIFNHTPEMIGFFSKLFKYKYPWDKYAQVVTKDYVSGAMENTGAVIFGDFVQKTSRELIDNDNDAIVAHELSHHWFGDLVTIESWANLTLNEGFANYAEYLWLEHKYGKDKADEHRQNELSGYLSSAMASGLHPLIHYRYADKEAMFDAHSYNKGGLTLHYLRSYVGDDAFFESLAQYLKKNEYTAVEVDELRMAFEDVTGEDLHWFFDQFYLKKGHPEIKVNYQFNPSNKNLEITAKQKADNIFEMPIDVAVYDENNKASYHRVWLKDSISNIIITLNKSPKSIVFDGRNVVPGVVIEEKSNHEWLQTYKASPLFGDKLNASQMIEAEVGQRDSLVKLMLYDKYHYFRNIAINAVTEANTAKDYTDILLKYAQDDENSIVRASALRALAGIENIPSKTQVINDILSKEQAYPVIGEALSMLFNMDSTKALTMADALNKDNIPALDAKLAGIFGQSKNEKYLPWFAEKVKNSDPYVMYEICQHYNSYLINSGDDKLKHANVLYSSIAKDQTRNKYNRYIATANLFALKNYYIAQKMEQGKKVDSEIENLANLIKEIKAQERDPELIEEYSEF